MLQKRCDRGFMKVQRSKFFFLFEDIKKGNFEDVIFDVVFEENVK